MSNTESLLEIIQESSLSETTKSFFMKKVKKEGATDENVVALSELLRALGKNDFAKIALLVDPSNPKIVAAQAKMAEELKAAADKHSGTIKQLEQESERLASDIQEDLKHIEKIVVDAAKAEA